MYRAITCHVKMINGFVQINFTQAPYETICGMKSINNIWDKKKLLKRWPTCKYFIGPKYTLKRWLYRVQLCYPSI